MLRKEERRDAHDVHATLGGWLHKRDPTSVCLRFDWSNLIDNALKVSTSMLRTFAQTRMENSYIFCLREKGDLDSQPIEHQGQPSRCEEPPISPLNWTNFATSTLLRSQLHFSLRSGCCTRRGPDEAASAREITGQRRLSGNLPPKTEVFCRRFWMHFSLDAKHYPGRGFHRNPCTAVCLSPTFASRPTLAAKEHNPKTRLLENRN